MHFLFAGLLVFGFASWRGLAVDPADRSITIDEERVTWLANQFEQTWQRSPNAAEIDQLIRDYVKEEVYYREALRMGLDQDDAIIRRRLRTKMEFLAASEVESAVPSDAELQAWLNRAPGRYADDTAYSFDQVYLGPANDEAVLAQASKAAAQLNSGANPKSFSKPISLPTTMTTAPRRVVLDTFGQDFGDALTNVKVGQWQGPVRSGFGVHLVRVTAIKPGVTPKLSDVRQQVENDWRAASLADRQARAYQALLDGYSVRIQKP